MILLHLLTIAGSVAVLTLGAELFVRGASVLALRLGISPLFVGLTIVGFGTSSPELGASLSATLTGSTGISVGNVIGSNCFNIALILGLTALIRPIAIEFAAVRRDLLVALGVCAVPVLGYATGAVNRPMGILCLIGLVVYLTLAYFKDRAAQATVQQRAEAEIESSLITQDPRTMSRGWFAFQIALGLSGLVLLILSSATFVHGATALARVAGISELIIGLTVVAAGTSLPELVTSVVAARRGNADVAVGNVIGSNIFNILGILGACAAVAPQPVDAETALVGIPAMILFSLLIVPFIRSGSVLSRREGGILVAGFLIYTAILIVRATSGQG